MFWTTVNEAHNDLKDLRSVIAANELLRDLLFPTVPPREAPALTTILQPVRDIAPARSVWALHDYCAAITRLYSILEGFIDSILKEYLTLLPAIYPKYADLPQATQTQHRIGVSQILAKLGDKGLFRHLTEVETLRGIANGNSGQKYTLLSDAFLTDTQNYRAEQINSLFRYLGIENLWAGVEKHLDVVTYMKTRDPSDTPKTLLKKIVDDRNLASHSGITTVLAPDEVISLIEFIETVIIAISETARKTCAALECSAGIREEMFEVLRKFSNNIVGVRFIRGSVKVGDSLIALDHGGAYKVTVISIRHHQNELESAEFSTYTELGLGLDIEISKSTRLISY